MIIESEFTPRDKVYIDGCKNLIAVVTAVTWRSSLIVSYEISWLDNGKPEFHVMEGWRLSLVENE